jgi:predicted metal-dependent peptidase
MADDFNEAMEDLDKQAHRQDAEERAAKLMSLARSRLVVGDVSTKKKDNGTACFFASLALGMDTKPNWEIDTAMTDGKSIWYNPDFLLAQSTDKAIGLVAHETAHPMMAHHARMGDRDPGKWNIACDLAINPLLVDSGFVLPDGGLMPGKGPYKSFPPGLSAEDYYPLVQEKMSKDGDGDGKGKADPGGCGGVMKPGDGSQAAASQAEGEWKVRVAQAAQVARQRGSLPAGIDRLVGALLETKVDWRDVLREFISTWAKNDYSPTPPNRRYLPYDLYLPTLRSQELGEIVIALDESGSINEATLQRFASETQGILESFDVELTILHHDSEVNHVQTWKSSDGPLVLEPKGGGGTSHVPVFDWIEKNYKTPTLLVCLTDLASDFPARAPDYPVLWAAVQCGDQKGPFGVTVKVED